MGYTLGLENCYIFKNSTTQEVAELIGNLTYTIKTYEKGSIIFSPDDSSNELSIILEGILEIQKIKMSGEVIIVDTKKPFDLIAAPSVYSNKTGYAGTIISTKTCKLMIIDKDEFTKMLMVNRVVMHLFLEFISNQVIFMNNRLELISHSTLKKKIIAYLLSEYSRTKDTVITIPYSKRKWSDYLNAQPPSVSRTLSKLEEKQYISVNRRQIKILDIDGLYFELS